MYETIKQIKQEFVQTYMVSAYNTTQQTDASDVEQTNKDLDTYQADMGHIMGYFYPHLE